MHLRADHLRCSQPAARADELDELVWGEVLRHLEHPELTLRNCAPRNDGAPSVDTVRQLAELRAQQSRLLDAFQAGAITLPELEARRKPIADRTGELEQQAHKADSQRWTTTDLAGRIDEFVGEVRSQLATMDFPRRQQLVRTVVDKVTVVDDRVEIAFKIPLPASSKEGRSPGSGLSRLRRQRQDPSKARLRRAGASRLLCPAHGGGAHLRLVGGSLRRRDPPGLVPTVRPNQEHPHVRPRRRRAQRAHRRVLRATPGSEDPGPIHRSEETKKAPSARRRIPLGAAGARGSDRSRITDTARAPEGASKRTSPSPDSSRARRRTRGATRRNHDRVTPACLTSARVTGFGEPGGGLL
jgi:hypothetical protein